MGLQGAGFDEMEKSFLTAVEDCNRLGVGREGAPHYWGYASRSLVGRETKRIDVGKFRNCGLTVT